MAFLSCVIPAYNEEAVGETVRNLKHVLNFHGIQDYEVIVVDDGSDTPIEAKGAHVLRHDKNLGYGAALKTGILKAKGDRILIMDADGTYPVEAVPELLKRDCDMAVGARTTSMNIDFGRRPAKWFLGKLANYLARTEIPDLNSGLRVFSKEKALEFLHLYPRGFSFTTTITLAFICNDYTVEYVPIEYHPRAGESKIKPIKDGMNFVMVILRTIVYFNPLRVFLPISALMLFAAFLLFLYTAFVLGKVMDITVISLTISSVQIVLFGLLADLIVKRAR